MKYAAALYFNEDIQQVIHQITRQICDVGIQVCLPDLGIRPHITLCVFQKTRESAFLGWLFHFTPKICSFSRQVFQQAFFPQIRPFYTSPPWRKKR